MKSIDHLIIRGYKSIKNLDIKLNHTNILLGGNGAGKSNFISFFQMLKRINHIQIKEYVAEQGGANKILFNGRKVTDELYFSIQRKPYRYEAQMNVAADDTIYIANSVFDRPKNPDMSMASDGEIKDISKYWVNQKVLFTDSIGIYHFQDTSVSSLMKAYCDINDNMELAGDGRNIAAMLYRLKKTSEKEFERIESYMKMVAPYFQNFILRENPFNPDTIRIEWKKKGCDIPFGAEQFSDGTLRFLCLLTLLNMPQQLKKDVVIIDEPELGLHPFAITVITELIKKYAMEKQIIVATQSVEFMNEFQAEDVIVVDNYEGESLFKRLQRNELEDWLEDYSLGDLWIKNVIGGRP